MLKNTYKSYPNEKGYFGKFGGRYVSETLMPLILEVEKEYEKIKTDKNFINEFNHYLKTYVGRPSPLFYAQRITNDLGGPKIYFKGRPFTFSKLSIISRTELPFPVPTFKIKGLVLFSKP